MQIVIDIPEKLYNAVTHIEFDANLVVDEMRKSIANGTPFPKGHGRLIDADELEKKAVGVDDMYMLHEIDEAPTIIEADKEGENGE